MWSIKVNFIVNAKMPTIMNCAKYFSLGQNYRITNKVTKNMEIMKKL